MYYRPAIEPATTTPVFPNFPTPLGLPPRDTARWTARRKTEIVAAVQAAVVTKYEVCAWYGLSIDEFHEWERAASRDGPTGLEAAGRLELA